MPSPDDEPPKRWRRPRKLRGLGDAVAVVAEPVARILDALAGTRVSGCGGCEKRRQQLNEWLPFSDL